MLLDTSGMLAFLDLREDRHSEAVSLFARSRVRITHSYVLDELIALATARDYSRRQVVEFELSLIRNSAVRVVWVDLERHEAALNMLMARGDKLYSLCDAVSFGIMREHGLSEALTTDRHFVQEGFVKLL